jgi:hypothetical protein
LAGAEIKAGVQSSAVRKLAAERVRIMSTPPGQWYTARFNNRNLLFHLRSRTGFRLRAGMIRQACWSAVVGFIAPERVLRFYLKKRYRIEREVV